MEAYNLEIDFHVTITGYVTFTDLLRTACVHNLPHAFLATVYKHIPELERRVSDRRKRGGE